MNEFLGFTYYISDEILKILHGKYNKLACSSVWVFIGQLVGHCGANAEAMGSNPVEAPKNLFSC